MIKVLGDQRFHRWSIKRKWWRARDGSEGILFRQHPDVAEEDGVAVVLEVDRALGFGQRAVDRGGGGEVLGEFLVLVDQDAVESDGDPRPGGPLAVGVELWRR